MGKRALGSGALAGRERLQGERHVEGSLGHPGGVLRFGLRGGYVCWKRQEESNLLKETRPRQNQRVVEEESKLLK